MRRSVVKLAERIDELENEMFNDIVDAINLELDFKHDFGKSFYDVIKEHFVDDKIHNFLIENFKDDIIMYLDTVGENHNNEDWLDIFLDKCYDYIM